MLQGIISSSSSSSLPAFRAPSEPFIYGHGTVHELIPDQLPLLGTKELLMLAPHPHLPDYKSLPKNHQAYVKRHQKHSKAIKIH